MNSEPDRELANARRFIAELTPRSNPTTVPCGRSRVYRPAVAGGFSQTRCARSSSPAKSRATSATLGS